ncbi:LysR family transcriptional regulator [Paenibacillus yanchengensis]|uniref:LysR family transcriptional regulator n=1 Tax=Paenibacillus yanchengensis TaxID=2035833 RepID=A0ABW4YQC4_9BACL
MIEELHMFALIVEHSSMNKAANVLNISQPALSRRLAKLEQEIGVDLFDRIGKRLELTRVGQLTYEYALELRQKHHKFMQSVAEFVHTERSHLTIGASLTTLQTTLPDIIQALTVNNPNIDIKAITGKTHEIVSYVRDHKVDIGIVASGVEDPLLHSTPLFHDHLVLVVPRNVLQAPPEKFSILDLNHLPMILFSKGTWYRVLTDELFEKYQLAPDVRMEIDSFEAILRLLHTCRAATLLPRSYMRQQLLLDNELAVINIGELENTKRTTSLIHLSPETMNPSVQLWVKQIASLFDSPTH